MEVVVSGVMESQHSVELKRALFFKLISALSPANLSQGLLALTLQWIASRTNGGDTTSIELRKETSKQLIRKISSVDPATFLSFYSIESLSSVLPHDTSLKVLSFCVQTHAFSYLLQSIDDALEFILFLLELKKGIFSNTIGAPLFFSQPDVASLVDLVKSGEISKETEAIADWLVTPVLLNESSYEAPQQLQVDPSSHRSSFSLLMIFISKDKVIFFLHNHGKASIDKWITQYDSTDRKLDVEIVLHTLMRWIVRNPVHQSKMQIATLITDSFLGLSESSS